MCGLRYNCDGAKGDGRLGPACPSKVNRGNYSALVKSGYHATLSRWSSRVRIPYALHRARSLLCGLMA